MKTVLRGRHADTNRNLGHACEGMDQLPYGLKIFCREERWVGVIDGVECDRCDHYVDDIEISLVFCPGCGTRLNEGLRLPLDVLPHLDGCPCRACAPAREAAMLRRLRELPATRAVCG